MKKAIKIVTAVAIVGAITAGVICFFKDKACDKKDEDEDDDNLFDDIDDFIDEEIYNEDIKIEKKPKEEETKEEAEPLSKEALDDILGDDEEEGDKGDKKDA